MQIIQCICYFFLLQILIKFYIYAPYNKVGHAIHDMETFYQRFAYNSVFSKILQTIGYKNPVCVQSMFIYKNPKIGAVVHPHVDNTYLITQPKQSCIGIVFTLKNLKKGLWFALHDATLENGCLWGVPYSHKQENDCFMVRTKDDSSTEYTSDIPDYNLSKAVPLEVKKGTLVMFDGNFIHYSKPNTSDKPRHAFTLHLVENNENSRWSKRNWLQRGSQLPFKNYYKEVEEIEKKHGGNFVEF